MKRRPFIKNIGMLGAISALRGCAGLKKTGKYTNYVPKGEIPRKTLGKTGIQVSLLGFGSHLADELIAKPGYRDRMIKLGFEGGINIYDVYDHMNYKQFKPMGKSIKGFRKDVVVSLVSVKQTNQMQDEIDGALRDFHTDYIDLYRNYSVDDDRINIHEQNKKAGKIRAIGIVSHDVDSVMDYIDRYGDVIDFVMIICNFHHNKAIILENHGANDYSSAIPHFEKLGLGIIGMKPMGSDNMIELAREQGFFNDRKANIAQAMLRYVYQTKEIECTIPAMNSMEELIANLESVYNPALSTYEKKILDNLSKAASSTKGAYLPNHYKWLENWSTKNA